jgi:hypothetical protein
MKEYIRVGSHGGILLCNHFSIDVLIFIGLVAKNALLY